LARSGSKIVVVVGICLVALGAGNAITGNSKMIEYRARKRAAIAAGGESVKLPFSGTPSILDPTTDAQLLYESAAIKYEYYRIVRRGGYYFLGFGVTLLVGSALRSRVRRRPGSEDGTSFQVTATPG
jgi:hypothetical protein